jgi:hypothetical protein
MCSCLRRRQGRAGHDDAAISTIVKRSWGNEGAWTWWLSRGCSKGVTRLLHSANKARRAHHTTPDSSPNLPSSRPCLESTVNDWGWWRMSDGVTDEILWRVHATASFARMQESRMQGTAALLGLNHRTDKLSQGNPALQQTKLNRNKLEKLPSPTEAH